MTERPSKLMFEAATGMDVNNTPVSAPALTEPLSQSSQSPNSSLADSPDSGYASIRAESTQKTAASPPALDKVSRKLFTRKITKLKMFDKAIPVQVEERFADLMELFNGPLCTQLCRFNFQRSMLSVRLKVLGECEATAKPWVLVQCDEALCRSVRRFFNQKVVKLEFQPQDTKDPSLPALEVIVIGRPPRSMAANASMNAVHTKWSDPNTLCGQLIQIRGPHETRLATVGGVFKVHTTQEAFSLCVITAGHALHDTKQCINDVKSRGEDNESEYEDDEMFPDADDPEFEIEGFEEQLETEPVASCSSASNNVSEISIFEESDFIGQVYETCNSSGCNAKDFDWALIKLSDPSLYRPNLLVLQDEGYPYIKGQELRESGRRSMRTQVNRTVVMLGGSGGFKWGRLTSRSFLRVPFANVMVETFTMLLNKGEGMPYPADVHKCMVLTGDRSNGRGLRLMGHRWRYSRNLLPRNCQ